MKILYASSSVTILPIVLAVAIDSSRVSPRQSLVNSCKQFGYIFLASGFPDSVRVFIASLPGLSGLHLTPKPLISFNPSPTHTLSLPNPHRYVFTGALKVLGVWRDYIFRGL